MVMKTAHEAFVVRADIGMDVELGYDEFNSPEVQRFAILDSKLCILKEWPEINGEIEVVKGEYPDFYAAIREYVETLEQTNNIKYLREKLRKEYDRKAQYINGGLYQEKYTHSYRRPIAVSDGDDLEPYVRMQPKVGRKAPCPCGSGKKYKKCCGRG